LIFFLQIRSILPNLQQDNDTNIVEVMGYNCYFGVGLNWKTSNIETIGLLLTSFFDFYSTFDYSKYVISIRLGKLVLKSSTLVSSNTHKLVVIEDPFEIDFNCGRLIKSATLMRIKKIMKATYVSLYKTKQIDDLIADPEPNIYRERRGNYRRNRPNSTSTSTKNAGHKSNLNNKRGYYPSSNRSNN